MPQVFRGWHLRHSKFIMWWRRRERKYKGEDSDSFSSWSEGWWGMLRVARSVLFTKGVQNKSIPRDALPRNGFQQSHQQVTGARCDRCSHAGDTDLLQLSEFIVRNTSIWLLPWQLHLVDTSKWYEQPVDILVVGGSHDKPAGPPPTAMRRRCLVGV
jgi:hypothetical protein